MNILDGVLQVGGLLGPPDGPLTLTPGDGGPVVVDGPLDIAGPLTVARPPDDGFTVVRRAPPNAADAAAGFADYTEVTTRSPSGEGGAPDNGWAAGFNAHVGSAEGYPSGTAPFFRTAIEQDWRPGGGQRWYEWYLEMRGPGHTAIRRPLGIVFDKVANRGRSFSTDADTFLLNDGVGVTKLQVFNENWYFADPQTLRLRGNGSRLRQRTADGSVEVNLIGLRDASGEIMLGGTTRMFFGNLSGFAYNPATNVLSGLDGGGSGPQTRALTFGDHNKHVVAIKDAGGGLGMGFGASGVDFRVTQYNASAGANVAFGYGPANTFVNRQRIWNSGDFETLVAGKGYIAKSPDGLVSKRIGIDNSGNVVVTAV